MCASPMVLHTTYPEVWIANTRECVFWNYVNDDDEDNDVNAMMMWIFHVQIINYDVHIPVNRTN